MSHVLAFGTYNVKKHPRVAILIDGLRSNGCTVTEINHPLTLSTAERVDILNKPWKLLGFLRKIISLWRQLTKDAKLWSSTNPTPDAILVGYMGHFDVLLAHHLFHGTPIVLDHLIFAGDTAKDRGAKGIKVRLLNILDRIAINAATIVLTDTEEHQRMLHSTDTALVVPVGAEARWYEISKHATHNQGDIVFFGLYTPLQGVPVIAEALAILNGEGIKPDVTLIGDGQDYHEVWERLHTFPNIHFIEWVPPDDLPRIVADHRIALGIFSTTSKGLHVIPNKVYESMAAGCAVVTSDTPPQRRLLGNGVTLVRPGDPVALSDSLRALLLNSAQSDRAMEASISVSANFTAEQVTRRLSSLIDSL